jgi:nitronate monooxygenase
MKHYNRLPDAIVTEAPGYAGGHLGARFEDVNSPDLIHDKVVPELVEYLAKDLKVDIPVIAAGGIWDRSDIDRVFSFGARGVQMATRFVCTFECDAPESFKKAYMDAAEKDIVLLMSPAGLPGRAIRNKFLRGIESGVIPDDPCFANCLTHCTYQSDGTNFCIATALAKAQRGDAEGGLLFCGSNAYRCREIVHVSDIIEELFGPVETTPVGARQYGAAGSALPTT